MNSNATPPTQEAATFPIMRFGSIPWEVIAPFEHQAQTNHHQSLKRLAERGGLSACEAVAILEERKWERMEEDKARARVRQIVEAHENSELSRTKRELASVMEKNENLEREVKSVWEAHGNMFTECAHAKGYLKSQLQAALAAKEEAQRQGAEMRAVIERWDKWFWSDHGEYAPVDETKASLSTTLGQGYRSPDEWQAKVEECERLAAQAAEMEEVLKAHFDRMERRYIEAELHEKPIPEERRDPLYRRTKQALSITPNAILEELERLRKEVAEGKELWRVSSVARQFKADLDAAQATIAELQGRLGEMERYVEGCRLNLSVIAEYGMKDGLQTGLCPYGCDTPNIAAQALSPSSGEGKGGNGEVRTS